MAYSMGDTTREEFLVLRKFRQKIAGLELVEDDRTNEALLKWLRARDLDADKANEMLRKSLQWRLDNDIANILKWEPPPHFYEEFPYEIYGYTAKGCPVFGADMGKWDFKKISGDSQQKELWLKYTDMLLAQVGLQVKKYRRRYGNGKADFESESKYVAILDFDGLSITQFTSISNLSAMHALVRRFEANYPEVIHSIYIVNASWIFLSMFKIIKPWLTARTLSKIQVFGTNYDEWKAVLLENIPVNQLAVKYGGTFTED